MKSIVTNVKEIAVKAIDFTVKFVPLITLVGGLVGITTGLVAAPVALTAIGGVTLVCSAVNVVTSHKPVAAVTFLIESIIVRKFGYMVFGKVVLALVAAQVVVIGGILLIGLVLAGSAFAYIYTGEQEARVGGVFAV